MSEDPSKVQLELPSEFVEKYWNKVNSGEKGLLKLEIKDDCGEIIFNGDAWISKINGSSFAKKHNCTVSISEVTE